jgi:thymidylate synthase ThyX
MINSTILLDSINPAGCRLTTWILTYPRFFHSELMTHRVFSRNAASSRAIPVKRVIEEVKNNPAMPVFWGKNQSGMQASHELDEPSKEMAKAEWLKMRDSSIEHAQKMLEIGLHKQIANRVLEPFMHMSVILTGTEFENFFSLRAHKDAQPEFQELAYKMLDLYQVSEPKKLKEGEWHIPFGDKIDEQRLVGCEAFKKEIQGMEIGLTSDLNDHISLFKRKIATARCARVSYLNFEGKDDYNADIELCNILSSSGHWSPFEHCAQALRNEEWYGNFKGWKQYRKFFNQENREDGRVQRYIGCCRNMSDR